MPKRLLIIGLLFCLNGLFAIWGIISDFIQSGSVFGELVIDTNTLQILSLPIGIGLLLGKQWSQWWARILIVVGYIFSIVSIIVAILSPEKVYMSWFGQSYTGSSKVTIFLTLMVILIVILVCMHRLLYSEKTNDYFNNFNP